MKAVLLSVKPEYCELIANGKKTVEIRKNRPKTNTPFKCYIYCTLNGTNKLPLDIYFDGKWHKRKGKVIGEFVCDNIQWNNTLNLWIAEDAEVTLEGTCLTKEDMYKYLGVKSGTSRNDKKYEFYAWHISDLVIYDEPKELNEFYKKCNGLYCRGDECEHWRYVRQNQDEFEMDCACNEMPPITRPPQSWCYVEELE